MATLTIEISDKYAKRVLTQFARVHGWKETIERQEDGKIVDNPQTAEDFTKDWIFSQLEEGMIRSEVEERMAAAREEVQADVAALDLKGSEANVKR